MRIVEFIRALTDAGRVAYFNTRRGGEDRALELHAIHTEAGAGCASRQCLSCWRLKKSVVSRAEK